MIISIHRDISNSNCVMGRLYADSVMQGYSIERPWLRNLNDVSCVPDGAYDVVVHPSSKYGPILALVNPELDVYYLPSDRPEDRGRYLCLVAHVGNWAKDVQGCVALGETRLDDMVGSSRTAIREFMGHIDLNSVTKVVITSDDGLHN